MNPKRGITAEGVDLAMKEMGQAGVRFVTSAEILDAETS